MAIGELDHFGVVLEPDQRRDRPERFLTKDLHVRRNPRQHRRFVERAAERMPLAAGCDLRAMRFRIAEMRVDLVDRFGVDQRALRDAAVRAGSDFQCLDPGDELGGESVVDLVVDEEAVRADARLARIPILRNDRPFGRCVEVGIVEHDERRIAAELE